MCSAGRKSFRISHFVSQSNLWFIARQAKNTAARIWSFRTANVQISYYLYPAGYKFKAVYLSSWMPLCNMTVMAVVIIFQTSDGSINASLLTVFQVDTVFLWSWQHTFNPMVIYGMCCCWSSLYYCKGCSGKTLELGCLIMTKIIMLNILHILVYS